jgi:hypothetical protein
MRNITIIGGFIMNEVDYLKLLTEAVYIVARVTGGFASLTDREGMRILTVNSLGEKLEHYIGTVYDVALKAGQENRPVEGYSQISKGARAWAIPLGPYIISCSNVERALREERLQQALEKALPIIAKAVGGRSRNL